MVFYFSSAMHAVLLCLVICRVLQSLAVAFRELLVELTLKVKISYTFLIVNFVDGAVADAMYYGGGIWKMGLWLWLHGLLWLKFQRLTALLHAEVSDHWFLVALLQKARVAFKRDKVPY